MMYTLIVSFVFSRVVDSVLDGAYAAKGILIVSNHSEEIGQKFNGFFRTWGNIFKW